MKKKADLPRFLSYRIDIDTVSPISGGLYQGRQTPLIGLIFILYNSLIDEQNRKNMYFNFFPDYIPLIEINRYTEAVEKNPQLFEDHFPFLEKVYKEYQSEKNSGETDLSFARFVQKHPSVLKPPSGEWFAIPRIQDGFMGRIFQKFDEYSKCVKEREQIPCEELDEKKTFIKGVLDTYKPAQ